MAVARGLPRTQQQRRQGGARGIDAPFQIHHPPGALAVHARAFAADPPAVAAFLSPELAALSDIAKEATHNLCSLTHGYCAFIFFSLSTGSMSTTTKRTLEERKFTSSIQTAPILPPYVERSNARKISL